MNIPGYDAWKLQGPPESPMWECECGEEHYFDGEPCEGCGEERDGDYGAEPEYEREDDYGL